MNIMNRITWKSMWENRTRTLVTVIGVILSAAMFMAVTTTVYSLWDFQVRGRIYETGDFFVSFDGATEEQAEAAMADEAVTAAADMKVLGYFNYFDQISPSDTHQVGAVDESFFEMMPVLLTEGRLPQNSGELLITERWIYVCKVQGWDVPQVGDRVTLPLFDARKMDAEGRNPKTPEDTVDVEYTIVGIMEDRNFRTPNEPWGYYNMLTLADGSEGECLWHRVFLKSAPIHASYLQSQDYGAASALNQDLLALYGLIGADNMNLLVMGLGVVLVLIIMVASVSLIGNAFSISVAERTKQFGLLSSIGATKKQIRAAVRFEALAITALGLPLGILGGYSGIAVVLYFYGEHLTRLFTFSVDGAVDVYAVLSVPAVLAAVLVCALTVWISAWVPSRKASKVMPMEAIRQSGEYKTGKKDVKVSPLVTKLFGIPGYVGAKYYKNSRRKYRTTILALTVSLVLFVFSGYFSNRLEMVADAQTVENYDFSVRCTDDNGMEIYEKLRSSDAVERSVLTWSTIKQGIINTASLHESYKNVQLSAGSGYYGMGYDTEYCVEQIMVYFLEDAAFAAHLESEGIDPAPYLEEGAMLAVTTKQRTGGFYVQGDDGEWYQSTFYGHALRENARQIICIPSGYPSELGPEDWWAPITRGATDAGELLIQFPGTDYCYVMEITGETVDGQTVCNYYRYDPETRTQGGQVEYTTTSDTFNIGVGAQLKEVPYGIGRDAGSINLILPLSKMEELGFSYAVSMRLDASDYEAVLSKLEAMEEDNLHFSYDNYRESEMNTRGIVTLLRVFSAGFITLISLIACANVFNTITTNIALRRRDFGMLRSMGFTQGDLYRMLAMECLNYGLRTVLWSIPLSIAPCYGLYHITNNAYKTGFELPWDTFGIGVGLILTVIFASTAYAVFTIRKDNPIDAIRMENT